MYSVATLLWDYVLWMVSEAVMSVLLGKYEANQ